MSTETENTEEKLEEIVISESERILNDINATVEAANKQMLSLLVNKYNYKQRDKYRLINLRFIAVPTKENKGITLDLVAFGVTCDRKLYSITTNFNANEVVKNIQRALVHIMRWGLRQVMIEGTVVSDEAYI